MITTYLILASTLFTVLGFASALPPHGKHDAWSVGIHVTFAAGGWLCVGLRFA